MRRCRTGVLLTVEAELEERFGLVFEVLDRAYHALTLPQHLSKRTLRRCNAVAPSCH
jgi:hypothetical protein